MHDFSRVTASLLCGATAVLSVACASAAVPPDRIARGTSATRSPAGSWDGVIRIPGSVPMRMSITLDSSAGAWRASMLLPQATREAIPLDSVTSVGDSLLLYLPASAQGAIFRGAVSLDGKRLAGTINRDGATFHTARAGTSDAAALVAEVERVTASRRVAAAMRDTSDAPPHSDPDSA